MIDDLRHLPDAFSLGLTPEELIGALCVVIAIGAVFADYL